MALQPTREAKRRWACAGWGGSLIDTL